MVSATVIFCLAIVALLIGYLLSQRKPKNFPPGPWGFPILGHLPLLGQEPYKTVIKWKRLYGPIVGIDFASFRCIVISDHKLIKEAMNDPAFSGRPKLPLVLDRSGGQQEGILFTEGKYWQEQRRFSLRRMRDFGFGTKSMEAIVQDDLQDLIEQLKKEVGVPISTANRFNVAVVNALWTIMNGERFNHNDPELNKIIKLVTANISDNNVLTLVAGFIPWLAKLAPNLSGYSNSLKGNDDLVRFIEPYIDSHFKTHQPGHPRDFLDTFIDEMKNTTDPSSSFHMSKRAPILFTLLDLFVAGTETTSTTLTWIFLYMALHPEAQEKLAIEIERVIGKSRLPSLADRMQMPYTEAVIHEVMRVVTLVPMALMHSTLEDVQFQGYDIPKETMVLINLYEAHNNKELWGDPEVFRPERFLSEDGTRFVRQEGFMPFSAGKRICLGETLARDELFLFTTSLFQIFKVSTDPNAPLPTTEVNPGIVSMPQPHKLILTLRN